MLVPALRFPEFRGEGEWEEKKLGCIGKIITGKTPSTKNKVLWEGDVLFITPTDISEENKYQLNTQRYVLKTKDTKILPIGTIVYTCIASIGKIAITTKISTTNQQINSVIVKNSINNEFVYYALVNLTPWIKSIPAISTLPIINNSDFSEFSLKIPEGLKEQQKIADCLSSLDVLITLQTQKRDALKAHKKGLMQQLFPAEGKTQPKLRFPEFRGDGEWEEKSLGDVCIHFKGFAFKSQYYTASGRRIVRVSDMGFDYIKNETSAIYIKEDKAKLYEKWKLMKDDLIITTVGSKPPMYDSLVGRIIVVELKDEGSLLNQNAVCLRANKNIEQGFLNILFRRQEYISFIESIIRGNANQGSIALVDLFKYIILQPKPKEQQKIADCLSSIDALITAQSQKIDTLKSHKKGLMQQLFPAMDDGCMDAGGRATQDAKVEVSHE